MRRIREFGILKWLVFPSMSLTLAGCVAWFNIVVFGLRDGAFYIAAVAIIALFSIAINKYVGAENSRLAVAAFVFEVLLILVLGANAIYSLSIQREMSVARLAETNQKETITEIGKLRGSRTQRAALEKIDKPVTSQSVFARHERALLWVMAGELLAYVLAAFTLYALSHLVRNPEPVDDEFPHELEVKNRLPAKRDNFTAQSDSERQSLILSQKKERLSRSDPDRKDALKRLRDHLKAISFQHPHRWFKADLVRGGVTIRLFKRDHGHEISIAETTQSDKLRAAINQPDF